MGFRHYPLIIFIWILFFFNHWYLDYSCDADPAALAKYVVALVKKDKPMEELKEICIDQLKVFLSDGEFGASQIHVIIYYYWIYLFPFHILITE